MMKKLFNEEQNENLVSFTVKNTGLENYDGCDEEVNELDYEEEEYDFENGYDKNENGDACIEQLKKCTDAQIQRHPNATKTGLKKDTQTCIAQECKCGFKLENDACVAWGENEPCTADTKPALPKVGRAGWHTSETSLKTPGEICVAPCRRGKGETKRSKQKTSPRCIRRGTLP